jgi:NADPH:quinone reductase-like Zn-dependent oxidoreductase
MPKAVQFSEYGNLDVLKLVEVEKPTPKENEVVVKVKAAGINPGEDKIRQGQMHNRFPASFPSGEGSDFAGIVEAVGLGVTKFKINDEVAGHTNKRASHAEYVLSDIGDLTLKPEAVPWEVAGSLFVAGTTAYAAVKAVNLHAGDKVVVSGAGGGVGSIAAQLAKLAGAEVFGIAGLHDQEWLKSLGITPISYEADVADQIKTLVGVPDAFIDTSGKGYVKMAIDLGVAPQRINTITDFEAVEKYGVKADGSAAAASIEVLEELLSKVADGSLTVPIAKTFALENVKEAFTFINDQHHRGKVVLLPE